MLQHTNAQQRMDLYLSEISFMVVMHNDHRFY